MEQQLTRPNASQDPGGIIYPMNPMDYVLLVRHESLQRRGYCGLNVMLLVELHGTLPSELMRNALTELGRLYPALSAHVRYSPMAHRPSWFVAADEPLADAIQYSHHPFDSDGPEAWEPLQQNIEDAADIHAGPQIRVAHSQVGEDFHRLGIRWGHHLMDMEGGHLLLRALSDIIAKDPPALGRDAQIAVPSPYPAGFAGAALRAWQGRALFTLYDSYRQPRLVKKPENASRRCRFLTRTYSPEQRRRSQDIAAKRISAGPMRYSRAAIIGMARAYHKMACEVGRPREHYLLPFPLPVPRSSPRSGVHGNFVTIPIIVFDVAELSSWTLADESISRQLRDYHEKHRDAAMWHMYRAASRWPFGLTNFLTRHRRPRLAAGYTGYQFDDTVTRVGSAAITNLVAVGSMDCHPGWVLCRTTFGDTMNLSITYFEDFVDEPGILNFFSHLEQEVFGNEG